MIASANSVDTEAANAVRAQISREDAVNREVASIMRTPVDQLDVETVRASLKRAATVDSSYEVFVQRVYDRIASAYLASDRHASWFNREIILAS